MIEKKVPRIQFKIPLETRLWQVVRGALSMEVWDFMSEGVDNPVIRLVILGGRKRINEEINDTKSSR